MLRILVILTCLVPALAGAQDKAALADIRGELTRLNGEIRALRAEMAQPATQVPLSGDQSAAVLRLDRLEAELRAVTGQVEQLSFRIGQIVEDGTRRIGDLEFRLVELEGGDVSKLGETSTLGGDVAATGPVIATQPTEGVELAVAEKSDFEAAMSALKDSDPETAILRFGKFLADYPGGPLSAEAMFHMGEAQAGLGRSKEAARAYLDSFTIQPSGPYAARALMNVGVNLGMLGQQLEACRTLQEVSVRYPGDEAAGQAVNRMQSLGCS